MNCITALAYITFLNGMRRNAVWGLCLFALAIQAASIFYMDFFGRDLGRVISDFHFSIMWLTGMIFILFYAVHTTAWDDNHRIIDSILARPISRTEYVLGSMLGLSLLLLLLESLLGLVAYGELVWVKSQLSNTYFATFSPLHFCIAWAGVQLILLTQLAVMLLISSAIRGALPVMLLSIAYALICSGLPVVQASVDASATTSSYLLHIMGMIFPDFSHLDFKDAVLSNLQLEQFTGAPIWPPFVLTSIYIAIALSLASLIYSRRDIV